MSTLDDFRSFLDHGFRELNVYGYPFVYVFADLRGWAARLGRAARRDDIFNAVTDPLLEYQCTVVTPTFSYTDSGEFHVDTTPSSLGAFGNWILRQGATERSEHPLFSMAAMGRDRSTAKELVRDCGKSAFGARSVFERLLARRCLCVHLGHNINQGNTMIHYAEQLCGATYRYHKRFSTEVFRDGQYVNSGYSAFVRRLDVPGHDFVTDATRNAENMRRKGIVQEVGSNDDLSNITVFDYWQAFEAMVQDYEDDPNVFLSEPFDGE